MNPWLKDFNMLKIELKQLGWQVVKDKISELDSLYSQGVLYSNFRKGNKVIHIEYGDECNVFGE